MNPTLELTPAEFRKLGYAAVDLIADAMIERNAGNELARRAVPEDLRAALMQQPLPEHGTDPAALLSV